MLIFYKSYDFWASFLKLITRLFKIVVERLTYYLVSFEYELDSNLFPKRENLFLIEKKKKWMF